MSAVRTAWHRGHRPLYPLRMPNSSPSAYIQASASGRYWLAEESPPGPEYEEEYEEVVCTIPVTPLVHHYHTVCHSFRAVVQDVVVDLWESGWVLLQGLPCFRESPLLQRLEV